MKIYSTYTRWSDVAAYRWIRIPILRNAYISCCYRTNYKYLWASKHINHNAAINTDAVLIPNNTSIHQLPIGRDI